MRYKFPYIFLAIFVLLTAINAYQDDEYYCRNDQDYQICRRCLEEEEHCERQDSACYCDNIAIYRENEDDFVGGSSCTTEDDSGEPYCYVDGESNCDDLEYSDHASDYQDLWSPKVDGETDIYYSYEACLPENQIETTDDNPVTGNENIIKGMKINSDYLTTEGGERVQHTFEDPEYVEGLDYPDYEEDYIPGYKKCQEQCLARNAEEEKGVCGAWSFDQLNQICFLFDVNACCGQKDKREKETSFISGYVCPHCWSTRNQCPCSLAVLQACPTCTIHNSGASKPSHVSSVALLRVDEIELNPDLCECKYKYLARRRKWTCRKPCCKDGGCLNPTRCRQCRKKPE